MIGSLQESTLRASIHQLKIFSCTTKVRGFQKRSEKREQDQDLPLVVDEHGTVKAWVDTQIVHGGQWTTYLRKPENEQDKNVTPIFYGGQRKDPGIIILTYSLIKPLFAFGDSWSFNLCFRAVNVANLPDFSGVGQVWTCTVRKMPSPLPPSQDTMAVGQNGVAFSHHDPSFES
ncbi:hypothetical protein CDAR_39741 [Caerostris darwini]|uniref:Uncharacterized protein n=1 Tax=Caerostris darwini TaxID=1538125 RepID=A0AAV4U6K4_9ARAC|nr:hypothetical protein CDAR_39741 [Caerostris darwini]